MPSKDHIELQSELIDRGIAWQVAGFAVVSVAATSALAIYSDIDALPFRFFEIAATKLNWAFVPVVVFIADWSREMFKKSSDIRAEAGAKVREKARQEGLKEGRKEGRIAGIEEGRQEATQETEERIRLKLEAEGVILSSEVAGRVFNHKNGQDS